MKPVNVNTAKIGDIVIPGPDWGPHDSRFKGVKKGRIVEIHKYSEIIQVKWKGFPQLAKGIWPGYQIKSGKIPLIYPEVEFKDIEAALNRLASQLKRRNDGDTGNS
jgi:hypothetical protein